jgi:hypothetical protein
MSSYAFFNGGTLATAITQIPLQRPAAVPVTRMVWLASRLTGRRLVAESGSLQVRVTGSLAAFVRLAASPAALNQAIPGAPLEMGATVEAATPIYIQVLPGLPDAAAAIPLIFSGTEERQIAEA